MEASSHSAKANKRRIHLHHQPRMTKKRGRVDYYSLATCSYEDGKNRKKIIFGIGELSKEQAEQYRAFLKALNGNMPIMNITDFESIVYKEDRSYLDVLMADQLWKLLGLDTVFNSNISRNQNLSTEHVARILTINKLLAPSSKIRTIQWLKSTFLPEIIGIDPENYEKNKVFRELANIHKHKSEIEKHFLAFSKGIKGQYEAFYFDGTTSWFEGSKCSLAEYDIEKTRGYFDQVIGFMLVTDNLGYPVAWDVVNGKTKDTTAFKGFIDRISNEYGFKEITYCFDRGVASAKNFDFVRKFGGKFISGIKDNQIKDVFDLQKFRFTRAKITDQILAAEETNQEFQEQKRKVIGIDGFLSFNDKTFFKDLGVVDEKRYIVSFNLDLCTKEGLERQKRIEETLLAITEKNEELVSAKKDRDFNATERDLIDLFKRHRTREFFAYTLLPRTSKYESSSFEIKCEHKLSRVESAQLTDGLLVYITDHVERKANGEFKLSARDIVGHYRGKYVVENAFREMKSFLHLRPIHVWKNTHVKAHFDIGVIAYFVNNYIYRELTKLGTTSLRQFYEQLDRNAKVAKLAAPTGLEIYKMKPVGEHLKKCFAALKIPQVYSPNLHKAHAVS